MHIKLFFGIVSITIALIAYFYYIRDVLRGTTKPHTFSWLIWGTLAANGFIAQLHAHGGIGAWVTGVTSAANFVIFCLALYKGDRQLTRLDWTLLVLALIGFILLFVISSKVIALWITILTLAAGFTMTIRKSYKRPQEETAKSFLLNAIKFIPSIPALSSFSFLTLSYPLVALLGNAAIVLVIYTSRRRLAAK